MPHDDVTRPLIVTEWSTNRPDCVFTCWTLGRPGTDAHATVTAATSATTAYFHRGPRDA
jgi:hypothetical protein